jgi:hypothetical protein
LRTRSGPTRRATGSLSSRWQQTKPATTCPELLGGTHELKSGVYSGRHNSSGSACEGTGGVGNDYLLYANAVPFEVLLYNSPFVKPEHRRFHAQLFRDNWRIGERSR